MPTHETHHITVEVTDRAKFDWDGFGYRWICSCGKKGKSWEVKTDSAYKSGQQHSDAKRAGEIASGKQGAEEA